MRELGTIFGLMFAFFIGFFARPHPPECLFDLTTKQLESLSGIDKKGEPDPQASVLEIQTCYYENGWAKPADCVPKVKWSGREVTTDRELVGAIWAALRVVAPRAKGEL